MNTSLTSSTAMDIKSPLFYPIKLEIMPNLSNPNPKPIPSMLLSLLASVSERQLSLWTPPSETIKALRDLCREYHCLKANFTQIKNQLHALKSSFNPHRESFKRKTQLLKFLQRQIALIQKELRALVKSEPHLAQHLKNIKTAKGLGDITILTVLAETRCFELVTNQKQLTSYAGLDIVFNDSGLKKGKTSISKKGNTFIRKALFMPALSACRANPQLKAFYQRLVAKGKNKKLAIIAVARKLLLLIYTLWKNNSVYIPDYKPVHCASEEISS